MVSALQEPDAPTLLLAIGTLYDAAKRKAPVWDAARDIETMRRLRERYAAVHGDSLPLVDDWIAEISRATRP